jgi:superfamily II DNA or RNA helicase
LLLSPTGSGKSLMIYALVRYYLDIIPKDKKILIVVPTTGLVSQMYSDFSDYADKSNWNPEEHCHSIFAGQDKQTNKRVVISTWQSIYKMDEIYFKQFGAVFGDECHLFKAKSLTSIMTKLDRCPYRIGTTGTLDDSVTHKLVIEGLFGRVHNITTTKELMEKSLLSHLSIDCITLKYKINNIEEIKRAKYDEEIKWIINNKERNNFIVNLTCSIKGNTLVLFNYVEDHGIPLFESIQEKCTDKNVYLIHGKTEVNQREEIRSILEKEKNAVLVASYGTCSTGINIKNINNIVFSSPSRSVVRVLQSIGRGLRKTDTKDKVKLYDISDDLRYKKYVNHTYRHLIERIQIYDREKFEHNSVLIKL